MCFKVILCIASVALVQCEPPAPNAQYGVPFNNGDGYNNGGYSGGHSGHGGVNGNAPSNSYGTSNYDSNNGHDHGHGHGQDGYGEPKAYEFGYQVKDDYTGTNYNRQEQSDGNQVTGSYRVALPDGRTQIVTYYADWKTGFHADVRYEGEAQFPEQYGNNNNHGGYGNNNNNNGYNNNNNNNYNTPSNQYGPPSNQYGAPVNPIAINNQYAPPSQNYGSPATSSVSIKDYSGQGNAYNANGNNYDYNNNNNNYDSYANSGFGNKAKPSNQYGAP